MFVRPINKLNIKTGMQVRPQVQAPQSFLDSSYDVSPSFLGQNKVYSDQIQALKLEIKEFPDDIEYRKKLMQNAGKNPEEYYKLRSVIGLSEIKSIMSEFNENEQAYSVGIDDKNIEEKTIRANLHIHTLASDGYLSTQELLDKAAVYANEAAKVHGQKKEPFTIAITDHDTTESAKEAIEIISGNPLKYKNLRVILGTEFTTYNNIATNFLNAATNTHVLAYGIDPNESTFNDFVTNTKHKKHQIAQKMINQANDTYQKAFGENERFFSLKEAKSYYNPLKKDILGIHNYVQNYIDTKIILDEIILKDEKLIAKLQEKDLPLYSYGLMSEMQNDNYQHNKNNRSQPAMESIPEFLAKNLDMQQSEIVDIIRNSPKSDGFIEFKKNIRKDLHEYKRTLVPKYDYMPTIKDVYHALENQKSTMLGLAHPLEPTETIDNVEQKYEFLTDYYRQFKHQAREKAGFSEVYYQSYPEAIKETQNQEQIKELLTDMSEELGLFKTGSADTHRTNIFKRLY